MPIGCFHKWRLGLDGAADAFIGCYCWQGKSDTWSMNAEVVGSFLAKKASDACDSFGASLLAVGSIVLLEHVEGSGM